MPKRILQGVVTSNACDKTVTVQVQRRLAHDKYKKIISKSKKYAAHDADNKYNVGDIVTIRETKPLSKSKTWEVIETN